MSFVEKEFQKIEQFWFDDKKELRPKFLNACKALTTIKKDDWFTFKNHRIAPPFTRMLMNAISILLGQSLEWKDQQLLLSDSLACARAKDDLGMRFEFDCKLVHMMKDYDVFHHTATSPHQGDFNKIMSDARFRRDSYYIISLGPPGPLLCDWVKSNYAFVEKAKTMLSQRSHADEERIA